MFQRPVHSVPPKCGGYGEEGEDVKSYPSIQYQNSKDKEKEDDQGDKEDSFLQDFSSKIGDDW